VPICASPVLKQELLVKTSDCW